MKTEPTLHTAIQTAAPSALAMPVSTPTLPKARSFTDADKAVAFLMELYDGGTQFLRNRFADCMAGDEITTRYRAFYPRIELTTQTHTRVDSRLAFGYVSGPGHYATTVTALLCLRGI